jgi:NAD-dependent dihydropyrimidine dehydrogenase PreA subunit
MTDDIYRQLQQRLDTYSIGFPATASGIEIRILKKLFDATAAALFLAMTPKLETAEQVAQRIGQPSVQVAAQLEEMAEKGLLFRVRKGDAAKYGAIPFVHGLFEFQVGRLDPELAQMVEQYHKEGFGRVFATIGGMFLRTVPVAKSITVTHQVAAYDDAVKILAQNESIVVADCICRKQKAAIGRGCGKTMEACFMFGSMGQYYVDRGMGRRIDVAEAVAILKKAQDSGLVTQPATAQNPAGMCNCCGDCCGVLSAIKKFPKPAQVVISNHFAAVDRQRCTGCETCLERCQMDAIALDDQGLVAVDRDRCIGCGLCVTTCPTEAMQLIAKPAAQHVTPPANSAEQMMTMAKNRGLL